MNKALKSISSYLDKIQQSLQNKTNIAHYLHTAKTQMGLGPPTLGYITRDPHPSQSVMTRNSAIAEGPCDMLSVETLLTVAQCTKITFRKVCNMCITLKVTQSHWKWCSLIENTSLRSNNIAVLRHVRDSMTVTAYVTTCDGQKSFNADTTVDISLQVA